MKVCSVDGCAKLVKATGLCWMHYMRKRRNGDFEVRKADDGAPMALVLAHIGYDGDECLIWPFARSQGYGVLEVEKDHNMHAHRYMCILRHGPPPFEGAHAAHNCGQGKSGCFAPNHVRWATKAENEADKFIHGTTPRGQRHGLSKLTNEIVLAIAADGRTQDVVATAYQVSQATVSGIRTGKVWSWLTGIELTRPGPNRGKRCRTVKLTDEQVTAIARDDRSAYKIAAEYGVKPQAVYDIRWGRNWSWLTGIQRKAA